MIKHKKKTLKDNHKKLTHILDLKFISDWV